MRGAGKLSRSVELALESSARQYPPYLVASWCCIWQEEGTMNDKMSLWSAYRTDLSRHVVHFCRRAERARARLHPNPSLLLIITKAHFVTTPQNELFPVGCHAASSTCDLATRDRDRTSDPVGKPYGFEASRRAWWMHVILERYQTWGLPTLARRVGSGRTWTGKLPKSCGRACDHAPSAVC